MFDAYIPKITLPSGENDIRKGDGIGMIINGKVMLVDAFQGDEATNGLISWLKSKGVTQIDLAVCTHAHGDHWGGFKPIVNAGIKIKEFRCYHIASIRGGNDASREDSDNLLALIRWLQARGTRVLFVDHGSVLSFEDTTWKIYRDQPATAKKNDTNAWEYVNNGSLVLWSPELELLLGGDGPEHIKKAIAHFGAKVSGYDISHHGNNCTESNAAAVKAAGCVVAWESCIERGGPGTTEWTEFGARRVRQAGIPVWMQNEPIYITAASGKIVFRQGSKIVTTNIPYQGFQAGWGKDAKGWFYTLSDGRRAKGWIKVGWSKPQSKDGRDWFFMDSDGYMVRGLHKCSWSGGIDTFYFDENGVMQYGWKYINGKWYFFDKNGAMKTGWLYDNGSWYYLGADGKMVTGWVTYKGKRCYLEPVSGKNQGHCYTSCTAVIDGKTYRFDKDGYATEEKGGGKSSLNGVDIASYQSGINPAKLTTTDFVIVKFTQGTTYLNPYADRQYSVAKAAGKLLGAYHYAEGKNAKSEAQYFVKCLGNRIKECVLALDWEGNQNSVFGTGKDVTWCKTFLDEVFCLTGIRPLIYMSKSVCRRYNWSAVAQNYPLWCAQYGSNAKTDYQSSPWTDNNGFGAWERDTIRQYSSHGRIAGYDANIDLDLAYMSAEEWRAMAGGKIQTEENPIDVAISIAESYLGYHEGANNKTIFGDTMHKIQPSNMDANAAWCDAFVDFVILKTCEHFGKGAETARMVLCGDFDDYTYNSVALYKKAGRWSNTAHRGDQIFFGGSGHTGIVESVNGGTVHTIEGNKGDEVRRGSYSVNSPSIIGYGRPRYDLITGKLTANDMPLIKKGSEGSAVLQLQKMLNAKGYKLTEDGDFGSKTEAAVKAYQKANGLEVDGEVGPMTWAALIEGSK